MTWADLENAFRNAVTCGHRLPRLGCLECERGMSAARRGWVKGVHDTAAENAVVASCMVDAEAVANCRAVLADSLDFFHERNAWAYDAILSCARKRGDEAVNMVTVAHELGQQGRLDGVGGATWLSRIIEELPTSVGADHYARIVTEMAERRRMIAAAAQVADMAKRGAADGAKVDALFGAVSPPRPGRRTTGL